MGITISVGYSQPVDVYNPDDLNASERDMAFSHGWFFHPLYSGDYPPVMKQQISEKSRAQGFNSSRLPEFTEEEKIMMKGDAAKKMLRTLLMHAHLRYAIIIRSVEYTDQNCNCFFC